MKNQVQSENEIREYLMFSEFELSDVDYDVTFYIVDIDLWYETVTLAITDSGRITQDAFQHNAKLYDNSWSIFKNGAYDTK